jgi:hypothetical protein
MPGEAFDWHLQDRGPFAVAEAINSWKDRRTERHPEQSRNHSAAQLGRQVGIANNGCANVPQRGYRGAVQKASTRMKFIVTSLLLVLAEAPT